MSGRFAQEADFAKAKDSDGPAVTTGPKPTLMSNAAKVRIEPKLARERYHPLAGGVTSFEH